MDCPSPRYFDCSAVSGPLRLGLVSGRLELSSNAGTEFQGRGRDPSGRLVVDYSICGW